MYYSTVEGLVNTIGGLAVIAFIGIMFSILFFALALKQRRLLDRYRLKYGFDKDLEIKEMDKPERIAEREFNFKRRTFKDMEEKK